MGKASRRKKVANPDTLAAYRAPIPFVARPFEGLSKEVDLVAMREIIPCATMTARTDDAHGGVEFDLVTLLPDGRPAMVRSDGRILVALQTRFNSADLSHDVAAALLAAIDARAGGDQGLIDIDVRDPSERLQDVLDPEGFTAMKIVDDFSYWFDPAEEVDDQTRRALEQNREEVIPTEAVPGTTGMFWCEMNRNFVRYATDIEESPLFDALARLAATGRAHMGEGSRFVGAFRACGIAIPVFELAEGVTAVDVADDAQALAAALDEALASSKPLTADERRLRQGLVSRQVTIR
ncbi:DUF5926 family protein [Actinomyces sp. B33]|uniref:DUF5926 family protein n=1 Tax=Actinomyces sp. B33 TaxID=2942131 RepID=UPI002340587F|nr:DUF5926 family protein [Actinomyces sp. B33]MDC4232351.1 DUF5926 family protein [Actinomyces sp. B33]